MNQIGSNDNQNHEAALANRAKAVKVLLQKMNSSHDETVRALELLRYGREYSISHFSPDTNPNVFIWIIKFQDNPEVMEIIMDWYRLQCIEFYLSSLKENRTLKDRNRQKLFDIFAKHFLDLSYDDGHISSFVIGQRKFGLESLVAMEESMQKKVDSIRYRMEKETAKFKKLFAKMDCQLEDD